MAARTVNSGGGPAPDYPTLAAALAGSDNGDTIEIQGTWGSADTAGVTWNKSVTVTADSSSKQIGRPWQSGDTHYRLEPTSGHVFTCTADVNISDLDIELQSPATSEEIFRLSSACSVTINRCCIGFSAVVDQCDVLYYEWDSATETFTFNQCYFHAVGRSIIDNVDARSTITINFNSCASYDIGNGSSGARNNGCWVGCGSGDSAISMTVNAHNCLIHCGDTNAFSAADGNTFNVDAPNCITNLANVAALISGGDVTDDTGTQYGHTWADTDQGAGDYVILRDVTTLPYDQRLPATKLTNANNQAEDMHAVATDAGLTIPSTDIVGTARPGDSNYCVGAWEYVVAGGGSKIPVFMHHYTKNLG